MAFKDEVEIRGGLVWPKADSYVLPVTLHELPGVKEYAKLPAHKRVVVQAGGNCGIFPNEYSSLFETVYTFEPDPLNFFCLTQNASAPNVIKLQAALGCDRHLINVFPLYPNNIAGYGVSPGGFIPTIKIDELGLENCDLIQLDVEGSEFHALLGGRETIMRFRPVIVLEIKELPNGFGPKPVLIYEFLASLGYRAEGKLYNDEIFFYGEAQS